MTINEENYFLENEEEIPYFQVTNEIFDIDIQIITNEVKNNRKTKNIITRNIKSYEKLVYIYLSRCANNKRIAFPSYSTIARKCSISKSSAINAIEVLRENKMLIKKTREKSSNIYMIRRPSKSDAIVYPVNTTSLPSKQEVVYSVNNTSLSSKHKKEQCKKNNIEKEIYINIVEYLNKKANTNYRATTKKTKDLINARLTEGFEEKDFYTVIDKKTTEWLGTDMEKYLRPETLFGNKFESYLNQKIGGDKNGNYRSSSTRKNNEESKKSKYNFNRPYEGPDFSEEKVDF
ncbi:conserved phage C-terminal domain-containing protein [Clostridium botulinum]|uniref:conserved phage C-terminal domain-containing protein n=1 Tax=Clostridium botulinum TaxID=1491 RepID=UPI000314FCC2|nr:conserved phage C-terminal domain-containing protein [Clostridium botulinum]KLU74228.1 putative phage replication [Clostridium botulinum V891]